jgi:hypothetical protein
MAKQWTDMDTEEKFEFLRNELIRASQTAHQIRTDFVALHRRVKALEDLLAEGK